VPKPNQLTVEQALNNPNRRRYRIALSAAGAALALQAITGCAVNAEGDRNPSPTTSSQEQEYVAPTIEEELLKGVEANKLEQSEVEVYFSDYESMEEATEAWLESRNKNCILHGNIPMSPSNKTEFLASSQVTTEQLVLDEFGIKENQEVCKAALFTEGPESDAAIDASTEFNAVVVANKFLGNTVTRELAGDIEYRTLTEDRAVGIATYTYTRTSTTNPGNNEELESQTGFDLSVAEDGRVLWSKPTL